jgi:zinc protease
MKRAFLFACLLALFVMSGLSFAQQPTPVAPRTPKPTPAPQTGARPGAPSVEVGNQRISIPPLPKFEPQKPVRIQLENGLVIFLQEDHELPLIDGIIRIRGGGRNLPPTKAGMQGIYGGSWRTGGTEAKTGDQLDDFLEPRAAKVETSAGVESSAVTWSCLKGDFADVFPVVLDVLLHPAFRQEKIDLAKQQANTAISRRNDDLRGLASLQASQLAYGRDNPYARVPQYDTVAAITRQDLLDFHKRTVAPANIIIGVVGDFDRAQMEAALRQAFGSMPRGEPIPKPQLEFHQAPPAIYAATKEDVNQAAIRMVSATSLQRKDPDFYAVAVMDEAFFSGGFSSRFTNEIRTKRGLAYAAGGTFTAPYDHPGIFIAEADTKGTTAVEAVQAMRAALQDAATRGITPEELQRAKDSLLNSFIFRFDSKEKLLGEQMLLEFYGYPLDLLEQYPAKIKAITADDVNRVAKKYIHPDQVAVLVVGNPAQYDKPLSTLGEVKPLDISIPPPKTMAATAAAAPAGAAPVDSKALLAKMIEGLGGAARINAVQAIYSDATVQTPQGEIHARQTLVFPDKLRQDLESARGSMSVVVTPTTAFATMGAASQDLPGSMRQEIATDIKRNLLYIAKHANDPAQTISAAPGEKVGDVQTQALTVTNGNMSVQLDIDPATGRVLRSHFTSMRPTGPAQATAELSDWRKIDGLMFPFTYKRIENGEEASTTTVNEIKVDPPIDPKQFEKPAASPGANPQ